MQIIPPTDKMAHFIVGVLIYAVLHFVGIGFALLMVVIAAIGKEVYDYFNRAKHTPEFMDAFATILGGCVGLVCTL